MKRGDIVKVSNPHQKLNLYEGVRDEEHPTETGESLFPNEIGLILETYHGIGNHTYHRILTPRNITGWIHEFHISVFMR